MTADEGMETGDPFNPLRQAATAQPLAVLVLNVHVVVGFSPVHANKDHLAPLRSTGTHTEPEDPQQPPNGSVLEARHPTSRHGNLTDQQGHDLDLELEALVVAVLTCWRLM